MENEIKISKRILYFIFNNNIVDVVKEIYKSEHLIEKSKSFIDVYKDNTKAWIYFIFALESKNLDILMNHIFNEKK